MIVIDVRNHSNIYRSFSSHLFISFLAYFLNNLIHLTKYFYKKIKCAQTYGTVYPVPATNPKRETRLKRALGSFSGAGL